MTKTIKDLHTSKKILGGSWVATIAMTVVCIVGSFKGYDMNNVTTLAGLAWGELTVAHGFYFWKAKNENRAKGVQALVRDLAEKYGTDAAARFAEIIYKD